MPRNERHTVPNPSGGWDVKKPHAERSSGHFDRQEDAFNRSKEILGRDGGGEAVLHDRNNRIRNSDTVAPGNDPFPRGDKK
jgi:hypothetical protein